MQNKSQRPRTADDSDRVAKWLRRWTANPIRSPCVATNPFPVGIFFPTGRKEATYAGKKMQTQSEKIHCRRNHTDFKLCDRLAEWLKRWTANPKYGLRAWVRIPILSVFFPMRAAGENYTITFIHRAIREDTLQNKSQRPRTSEHCDRVAEWLRR